MATERIQIVVSDSGTVTVKKNISDVGNAATKASSGVDMLKGALTALLSLQTIRTLVDVSDRFIELENKIKLVTSSTEQFNQTMTSLMNIANNSRTSVESVTNIYQKLARASDTLSLSQEEVLATTDLIAKATIVSGASAQEAASGILQLGQAMASGKLAGDEFRSISENMPYLLDLIAKGADLPREKLKQLGAEGKLSAALMINAFGEMSSKINEDFNKTNATIGQALTVLNNNFLGFIGYLNNSTGAASTFASIILVLANNLDLVMLSLTPLIAALSVLAIQVIGSVLISGLGSVIALFGAMATSIASATVAVVGMTVSFVSGLIPAIAALTVAAVSNPLISVPLLAALGGAWLVFGDRISEVAGKVWETAKTLTDMQQIGKFLSDTFRIDISGEALKVQIEAAMKQAGTDLDSSIKSGSKAGGDYMRGAISAGGQDAAAALRSAQAAGIARYEEMNGRNITALGNTLTDGGDYIYNQVTGSTTKAATNIGKAVENGGDTAGKSMEDHIVSGGKQASQTMYQSLESAFATLGGILDVFSLAMAQAQANIAKTNAETMKIQAETRQINSSDSPNGSKGIQWFNSPTQSYTPSYSTNSGNSGSSVGSSGGAQVVKQSSSSEVTVVNITDPNDLVAVNQSKAGQKSILNVIKTNRDDIRRLLGV